MLSVPSEYRGLSEEDNNKKFLVWRRSTPKFTTFRVNSLVSTPLHFMEILKHALEKLLENRAGTGLDTTLPPIWCHSLVPEVVAFGSWSTNDDLPRHLNEVIVDSACGAAVLRGAHVFVPGVLGLMPGASLGDIVSIYADIGKVCKRGWTQKLSSENRYFVGNGILLMDRKQIFCDQGMKSGIAVLVTDSESGCPTLPSNCFPPGMAVMQNLPSIVCGRVLDPQPGEIILDMCAAPGNKTTHLSALMNNEGVIIALDRSASRISKLHQLCKETSVKNVTAFVCNSVHAANLKYSGNAESFSGRNCIQLLEGGPPFPPGVFDRVLLDAPCSGLGQRPKLEDINPKHIASFPPLQKKLFEVAVKLLKPGGILVYSTCTIGENENEQIVRWGLDRYPCLQLLPAEPRFCSSAPTTVSSSILSPTEWNYVQKYVPSANPAPEDNLCDKDTIGFFIARFQKREQVTSQT